MGDKHSNGVYLHLYVCQLNSVPLNLQIKLPANFCLNQIGMLHYKSVIQSGSRMSRECKYFLHHPGN